MEKSFEKGEVVEHRLNKEWLMILEKVSGDQYLCRTKSFEEKTFNSFELTERKR